MTASNRNEVYSNVLNMGDDDFMNLDGHQHSREQITVMQPIATSQILARREAPPITQLNTPNLMPRRYSNQGEGVFEGDDRFGSGMEPRSAPLRPLRMGMGLQNHPDMSPGLKAASPLYQHQGMQRPGNFGESQSPSLPRTNFTPIGNTIGGVAGHPQGKANHYSHFGPGMQSLSNSSSPTYPKPSGSRNTEMAYVLESITPQDASVYSQRQPNYTNMYGASTGVGTVFEHDEDAEDYDGDYHRYSPDTVSQILYKTSDQKQLLARLDQDQDFRDSVHAFLSKNFPRNCKDGDLVQYCIKIITLCEDGSEKLTRLVNSLNKQVVGLCKDSNATRVLQRLIEKVARQKPQILRLANQLKGSVSSLVMCSNGNHVVQKLINHVEPDDISFVYEEILADFKAIGLHKHGCCVLQRCIDRASPKYKVG